MDSSDRSKHTFFDCFSPKCGAALVGVFADILAEGLEPGQIAVLGGFLAAVGDTLSYIGAQKELNDAKCPKKSDKNDNKTSEADNTETEKTDGQKSTDKSGSEKEGKQNRNGSAIVSRNRI